MEDNPIIGKEFATAQTKFPGPDGRYRIWIDCFLCKDKPGRLTVLVNEEPVGTIKLNGNENRWIRTVLPDETNLLHEATVTLLAEKVSGAALVDKVSGAALVDKVMFERIGQITAKSRTVRILRGPMVQWVTETTAYLVWETNIEAKTRLEFGPTPDYDYAGTERREVKRHVMRLRGLTANTQYSYRIATQDAVLAVGMSFRTNKPSAIPFRFVALGDSGTGGLAQHQVAQQVEKVKPDFIIHTGDLIYGAGERMNYPLAFFNPYAALIQRIGFYPCLGNHDYGIEAGQPFLDTFLLPNNGPPWIGRGRNYWFEYSDGLFVAVDSNTPEWLLQSTIGPWLEKTLRASKKKWKFVYFHHPPYSAGHRPETDADESKVRRTLTPILERALPTLVFCGHDHFYARLRPIGGVRYIVTGAGGAGLYPQKYDYGFNESFYNDRHSFTQIDITGNQLILTQINDRGETVDQFSLTSPR